MIRRRPIAAAFVLASTVGLSGCITDPDILEGLAMGLNETAAQMEWENRNCYWSPPPGNALGAVQRYCPGDYGYTPPVTYVAPRYRDDNHRHRDRKRDRDRDRDRRDRDGRY